MAGAEDLIDEKMIDEIADEILKEVAGRKNPEKISSALEKRNLKELIKLKNRVEVLENRLDKLVKSFKIESVEAERHISSASEELSGEQEQLFMNMQGQIEDLRTLVVRLGNDIKSLREKLAF